MKRSISFPKILKGLAAAVFWIAVWQIAAILIDKELFLPGPLTVAKRFIALAAEPQFWSITGISLVRILLGFVLGVLLGGLIALLTKYVASARVIIAPALHAIRATPVVSFILLAFLWLDSDIIPIFIAFLMVMPIVWENLTAGLDSLDENLIEMAKVFKIKRIATLKKIIFPSVLPHFYSGCLTSLGLAWKSGIAAEVISYPSVAIGREMNNARVILETADVLVWTVVVVALSFLLETLLKAAIKRGLRK